MSRKLRKCCKNCRIRRYSTTKW